MCLWPDPIAVLIGCFNIEETEYGHAYSARVVVVFMSSTEYTITLHLCGWPLWSQHLNKWKKEKQSWLWLVSINRMNHSWCTHAFQWNQVKIASIVDHWSSLIFCCWKDDCRAAMCACVHLVFPPSLSFPLVVVVDDVWCVIFNARVSAAVNEKNQPSHLSH